MASRVYDCVLFNGEFDALAIRIRELDDLVHRFVVVKSDTTFSGLKKTVQFTKNILPSGRSPPDWISCWWTICRRPTMPGIERYGSETP